MRHSICLAAVVASGILLTSCSSTPATPPVNSYLMGEKVLLGKLSYTVFETQWLTQLGEHPTPRIPQHRFFLVRISATNSGSNEVNVPNFTITDDKGTVYEELSNGEGVPQWAGYLRSARPVDTVQGNLLFDAPAGHYKLKLSDETGTSFGLVDLPLSYNAETPEVVVPGARK